MAREVQGVGYTIYLFVRIINITLSDSQYRSRGARTCQAVRRFLPFHEAMTVTNDPIGIEARACEEIADTSSADACNGGG